MLAEYLDYGFTVTVHGLTRAYGDYPVRSDAHAGFFLQNALFKPNFLSLSIMISDKHYNVNLNRVYIYLLYSTF